MPAVSLEVQKVVLSLHSVAEPRRGIFGFLAILENATLWLRSSNDGYKVRKLSVCTASVGGDVDSCITC